MFSPDRLKVGREIWRARAKLGVKIPAMFSVAQAVQLMLRRRNWRRFAKTVFASRAPWVEAGIGIG